MPIIIPDRFVVGGGVEGLSDRSRRLFGRSQILGPRLFKVSLLCMSKKCCMSRKDHLVQIPQCAANYLTLHTVAAEARQSTSLQGVSRQQPARSCCTFSQLGALGIFPQIHSSGGSRRPEQDRPADGRRLGQNMHVWSMVTHTCRCRGPPQRVLRS